MKYFLSVITVLIGLGSLSAQSFISKYQSFPVPFKKSNKIFSSDTLRILAVMSDFQEDRDGATAGNGKFGSIYSRDYGDTILDPLPHDKFYFESHLQFIKNYFKKVSNGKLNITYTILPDIYTVSKRMRDYAPPYKSKDFKSLADYSGEVWHMVDSANFGFDFSKYDVYTIFHAGVGAGFTLPGLFGFERNLPSIYIGPQLLKEIYGNSFKGFPVENNNFNISNSILMPETMGREISNFETSVLVQLTINGLLAANVGNAIGLPDLFNTETGESAIGRFGLMDANSFFAYNGLFPPEPSAWEKIYMGWASPVTIKPANYNIRLVANLAASLADTVILKVPISSTEYFLVENRERDVNKNGVLLSINNRGTIYSQTFLKDTTGFYSYSVDSVRGVVTDVDEFDWAMPGNGIVIWHVDENVINKNLATNTINAEKRKGLIVEEADGVQDIGETFVTLLGDEVIGEGTENDFWFKSNPSEFYKENKFSKDTRPNTNSNSGANSLITIKNFSDISNSMTFKIEYSDSVITPVFANTLSITNQISKLSVLQQGSNYQFGIIADSSLYINDQNGNVVNTLNNFSIYKPAAIGNTDNTFFAGAVGNKLNFYFKSDPTLGPLPFRTISTPGNITCAPVGLDKSSGQIQVLVGTSNGKIYIYSVTLTPFSLPVLIDSLSFSTSGINGIAVNDNYIAAISGKNIISSDGNSVALSEVLKNIALTKNSNGDYLIIASGQTKIYTVSNGKLVGEFDYNSSAGFSIADLKHNGQNYIVYSSGKNIEARNISGAGADNFSFTDPEGIGFSGTPLTADFEGDSKAEIIAETTDGRIFVIDGGTGKIINGFPLITGAGFSSTPVLYRKDNKLSLAVTTNDKHFYSWVISSVTGNTYWSSENGNNLNSAFVDAADRQNFINDFLPSKRAYNYPNPVYGNSTNIHYYVSQDSKINIKIFDIAGSLVDELNDFAAGGLDHETKWNVSNIQSGIYIARIGAESQAGKTETNIIKIAIVK